MPLSRAVVDSGHGNLSAQPFVIAAIRALCVAAAVCVTACGGGGGSAPIASIAPTSGGALAPSSPAPAEERAAALRLYESGLIASYLAQNVVWSLAWGGSSGRCVFGSGSIQLDVDGSPESKLLSGSHALSAAFDNCLIDGLVGTSLNGSLSGTYSFAGEYDYAAQFAARNISGSLLAYVSDLHAITSDGPLTLTSASTGVANTTTWAYTTTFTPAVGFRLVNNATGNVLTFGGGNCSSSYDAATQSGHSDFNGLELQVNGTRYTVDGSINWSTKSGRLSYTSGIVGITSGGVLHANLAGHQSGLLMVQVLVPLERL